MAKYDNDENGFCRHCGRDNRGYETELCSDDCPQYANPQFIVIFKQHGALNCEQQVFGPFADYLDAENALSDGSIPCLYGQGDTPWPEDTDVVQKLAKTGYRYIQPLEHCAGCVE